MTFLGLCSLSLSLSKRDYWKHFPCSSDLKRNWPPYSAAEREREQTTRSLCTPFLPKVSGEGVSAGSSPKPVQEKQPSDSPHAAGRRQERTENQAGPGFLQVSTSVRHNLFLRVPSYRLPYFTAGARKRASEAQGGGRVRFGGGPGISVPGDLPGRNERLLDLEKSLLFLAHSVLLSEILSKSFSSSKSHPFLNRLICPFQGSVLPEVRGCDQWGLAD